jgi:peptidoglycan/LPS O-acetylase OafA/YrhL
MHKNATGRFLFVDALRGIAALGVVLFHLNAGHHIPLLASALPMWAIFIIDHGNLGVAVFFVLSGFVISHSVHTDRVSIPFAGRFMLRRSLRLDPPYWVAIALTLAFALVSTLSVAHKALANVSVGQILAHMFYLQEMLGYPEVNTVFWTLCLEVQFYLIYILILALGRNDPSLPMQGRRVLTILTCAMCISLLWPTGLVTSEPWRGSFLPLWHGFLLGVGAYWSWRYTEIRPFFVGIALIVVVAAVIRSDSFSLTCAAVACLLLAMACLGRIRSALHWPWLQFLGAISYSLYLIHNPVTGASFRVGYMLTGDTMMTEVLWSAGAVCACVVFSACVYYLIEKPSMRLARMVDLRRPLLQPNLLKRFRR